MIQVLASPTALAHSLTYIFRSAAAPQTSAPTDARCQQPQAGIGRLYHFVKRPTDKMVQPAPGAESVWGSSDTSDLCSVTPAVRLRQRRRKCRGDGSRRRMALGYKGIGRGLEGGLGLDRLHLLADVIEAVRAGLAGADGEACGHGRNELALRGDLRA